MKDNGIKDTTINIRIDMASQYEIIFDENNRKLEVKLDNGQNLKITVINKKIHFKISVSFKINLNEYQFVKLLKLIHHFRPYKLKASQVVYDIL